MSKTAIVWLILYMTGIAASFIKGPYWGLITYMFTFYTQFSWARSASRLGIQRWALIVSIAWLISYLIKNGTLKKLSYKGMPQIKWLILIIINMFLLTPYAAWPSKHNIVIFKFLKLLVLYYLIINNIRDKSQYKKFIWLQVWGNYLFGWQAFNRGKIIAGRLENIGGPGINDSNHLANHVLMIIPFLGNMVFGGGKWEKAAVIWAAPFILNTLVLCNSRGAFLGLLVMGGLIILFSKKGRRLKILIGSILGTILFIRLADPKFWNRMQTIDDYNEEGSSSSRIKTWGAAIKMIKDYPLGKGGGGWKAYSSIYIPEIVAQHGGKNRSVHNTYLMMGTNWGVQGLFLLIAFLVSTFLELIKVKKRSGTDNDLFYQTESVAITIAIIGFLACAMFGNRIYAESLYWYCALTTALSNLQKNELYEKQTNQRKEERISNTSTG